MLGKVISFRLDDPNIKADDKKAAIKDAEAYFKLALHYIKSL